MKKDREKQGYTPDKQLALRVSVITVAVNLVLSVLKLTAGILGHSGAMISDAIHSASDVLTTFAVMIGVVLASKKADRCHPYGHERIECVVSAVLAGLLAATGIGIGCAGIRTILGLAGPIRIPGKMALAAAVLSIVVKEWMYWYTRAAAKKIKSGALMADAWHHRSDALSSVGALIGIFGAMMGYPVMDPIASVVICLFIEKVAYDIFRDAMEQMVDRAGSEELTEGLYRLICVQEGVQSVNAVKTRKFASKIYVETEICVNGAMELNQAWEIARQVHDAVERNFAEVKHCLVQLIPAKKEQESTEEMTEMEERFEENSTEETAGIG